MPNAKTETETETETPRKTLPVRINGELLDRIDAIRDPLIPRERYVRHLLTLAVEAEELKQAKRGAR